MPCWPFGPVEPSPGCTPSPSNRRGGAGGAQSAATPRALCRKRPNRVSLGLSKAAGADRVGLRSIRHRGRSGRQARDAPALDEITHRTQRAGADEWIDAISCLVSDRVVVWELDRGWSTSISDLTNSCSALSG